MSELEELRQRLREEIDGRERDKLALTASQLHEAQRADEAEAELNALRVVLRENLATVLDDALSAQEGDPFLGIGAVAAAKRIRVLAELVGSADLARRAQAFGERARRELAPFAVRTTWPLRWP